MKLLRNKFSNRFIQIKNGGGILSLLSYMLLAVAVLLGCASLLFAPWQSKDTLSRENAFVLASQIGDYAVLLAILAICVGLTALLWVAISKKLTHYRYACQSIALTFGFIVIMAIPLRALLEEVKLRMVYSSHGRATLKYLHNSLKDYPDSHSGLLPTPDKWCDKLIESDEFISEYFQFQLSGDEEGRSDFAFNESLAELKFSEVLGNTILLFEARGPWNDFGGQELLCVSDARFGYVFILFADGTIGRYWQDGALTLFEDKPEDDYLPLKWEP